MFKLFTIIFAAIAISIGGITYMLQVPTPPNVDLQKWWGDGPKPSYDDNSIRPFKIEFNNTMLEDLKQRLRNRRPLTKPLEGVQFQYGMNTIYLEKIINFWLHKYDFKGTANRLNKFPHYKTRVQGLDLHFIRVKSKINGVKTLPLLMLHGWPSSSKEFEKVIPMLTSQKNEYGFVFEVIAPDLPGFGFSEGTNKPGLNPVQIGIMMRNLMHRLGFNKYYIQAGDWGSQCATHMATLFPEDVLGFHTNMPLSSRSISSFKILLGSLFPTFAVDAKHAHRLYPLRKLFSYILRESGYFHLQATKPDTIGVALTDSPVGMAAYVMEKIGVCSNKDQINTTHGGIENLELDDVLDTITIIWANNCIVTSMRIYAEAFTGTEVNIVHNIPTKVPTAAINFLHEVLYQPDWVLRDKFHNLIHSTTVDFGGHFAALHTPQELVDDIFASVSKFIKFHQTINKNIE